MDAAAVLRFILHAAAAALATACAVLGAFFGAAWLVSRLRRLPAKRKTWNLRRVLFALSCALMTWYAGSKHVSAVWDEGFRDCRADVSTNDWRTVTFEWTPAPGVPGSALAEFWHCDAGAFAGGDTNAPLTLAGSAAMSALSWTYVAESASALSNMAWYVKCSYSRGPTVVTNGVYHLSCAETNGLALKWVPLGVRVYDGRSVAWRRISPPAGAVEPPKPADAAAEVAEGGAE